MNSAKLSFNQRSSHHSIVTKSPNHICDNSCIIVFALDATYDFGTGSLKTYKSLIVTAPAFSIAPVEYSGQKI